MAGVGVKLTGLLEAQLGFIQIFLVSFGRKEIYRIQLVQGIRTKISVLKIT